MKYSIIFLQKHRVVGSKLKIQLLNINYKLKKEFSKMCKIWFSNIKISREFFSPQKTTSTSIVIITR